MGRRISNDVGKFLQHYPRVTVIVTSRSGEKENAMAAAWHSAISFQPPLYGVSISPRRLTYKLILESGEFGVNFVPWEKADLVAAVGGAKGEEMDKFAAFHIEKVKPYKLSVPILKDAYTAYECRLTDHKTYGDHEWFVGEIVAVHFDPEVLSAKEEMLDLSQVTPVLYMGADFYVTTSKESLRYLERGKLSV